MTNYPTAKQDLDSTRGTTGESLKSPNHITHHNLEDDTVEALQDKVGIDSSADTSSLDYQLNNSSSISPGHKHAISDNTDVDTSGVSDGQLFVYESASSKWKPNTSSTPDMSVTVAGKAEEATEAEVVAGTATGGAGRLAVNPSTINDKILTANERTLVRAVEGVTDATEINQLASTTHIAESNTFFGATDMSGAEAETLTDGSNADALHVHAKSSSACGVTTRENAAGTGTQDIAHGLGLTPSLIKVTTVWVDGTASVCHCFGHATSTSDEECIYSSVGASANALPGSSSTEIVKTIENDGASAGTATLSTLDSTNITLNWTTAVPAGTARLIWEAWS